MGPSPILAVVTQPQNPFLKLNSPNSVTFKTSKIYCIETARQLLHNLYILGTSINKIDEHLQHRCESWISYNDRLLLQVK